MTSLECLLSDLANRLDAAHVGVRADAAAQLGDCLQHLLVRRADIDPSVCRAVVGKMLAHVLDEQNTGLKETILSALVDAAALPASRDIDWTPLVGALASLEPELVSYVLQVIAFSHDPKYRPVIERYRFDPDPYLRQIASESLIELRGASTSEDHRLGFGSNPGSG